MKPFRNLKFTLVVVVMFGMLGAMSPARATGLPVVDLALSSLYSAKWGSDISVKQTTDALLAAGKIAATNAFRYFTQKIAYDSAVYLASGGSGQKSLLQTKSFGDYMTDTGKEAAGSALDAVGKQIGVSLCATSQGPAVTIPIQLGLATENDLPAVGGKAPDAPTCTLDQMTKNFDGFFSQFTTTKSAFNQVGILFDPSGNDLGVALKLHDKVLEQRSAKELEAKQENTTGSGFNAQKSKIGKFITTPGSFIAQEAGSKTSDKLKAAQQGEFQSMTTGESLQYILANTAISFANTLAQRGLQRLTSMGFISLSDIFGGSDAGGASLYSQTATA